MELSKNEEFVIAQMRKIAKNEEDLKRIEKDMDRQRNRIWHLDNGQEAKLRLQHLEALERYLVEDTKNRKKALKKMFK